MLGEGGSVAFFSHAPLLTLAILTVIMALAALFADGNMSRGVRADHANRWVLVIFGLIGLLDAFLPAWSDRWNFWTFDGDLVRWIGVAIYAVGGALRIYPVFVLGRRFSGLVAIQPQHQLVMSGIYSVIRHPSYLGLIILMLGWALAFRSAIGVLLAVFIIPLLLARMRSEETLLHEHFGPEYDAYRARTSRLIPGIY